MQIVSIKKKKKNRHFPEALESATLKNLWSVKIHMEIPFIIKWANTCSNSATQTLE